MKLDIPAFCRSGHFSWQTEYAGFWRRVAQMHVCLYMDKEVVIKYFVQVIRIKILKVNDKRMLLKYVASRASTFMIILLPTRIMLVMTHIHGKGILTKRAQYAKTPLRPRLSKPPPAPSPPHCAYHATWKPARKRISQHASLSPRLPFERRPRADWAGTVREHWGRSVLRMWRVIRAVLCLVLQGPGERADHGMWCVQRRKFVWRRWRWIVLFRLPQCTILPWLDCVLRRRLEDFHWRVRDAGVLLRPRLVRNRHQSRLQQREHGQTERDLSRIDHRMVPPRELSSCSLGSLWQP